MQETSGPTSNLSYALESLGRGLGLTFEFDIGMATHKVEVTMFGASLSTAGLIETRPEAKYTSSRMRRKIWNHCVKRLSRIALLKPSPTLECF